MPPKRFLVYLGESIDKVKIRRMAELMELNPGEKSILLARFCDGLSIDQTADFYYITPAQQRYLVPKLEAKVMSWILDNLGFFNRSQLKTLSRWIPAGE